MNKKTVILDGLSTPEERHPAASALAACLKENQMPHKCYNISTSNMGQCIGCGYCGDKAPGLCFQKDAAADYTARLVQAGLLILLTKVRYGALEASVKRAMDRIAILGTAYFTLRDGQLFHKSRYKSVPFNLLVLAIPEKLPVEEAGFAEKETICEEEKQSFESMIKRDSEHLASPRCQVLWLPKAPEALAPFLQDALFNIMVESNKRQVAQHD